MASLGEIAKRLEKLVANNSPAILTAIGVTGALTTAYLTGRASFKAAEVIAYGEKGKRLGGRESFEFKDKFELTWKFYIPAATTAMVTVAAIICANRIGTRRAAAVAIAYSLSERAFEEYRDKIIDKMGPKREQDARDEIAREQVNRNPPANNEILITGGGSVLCYESFTGRYFISDHETLRKAENDINAMILHDNYAVLSDFYVLVGLPMTAQSDEIGWNTDKLLELQFSTTLTPDNKPCLVVNYRVTPVR